MPQTIQFMQMIGIIFGKLNHYKNKRRDTLMRKEPKRSFMRIQFTHENKIYTLETIASFAKYLAQRFAKTKKSGQTQFVADFALTSYDDDC